MGSKMSGGMLLRLPEEMECSTSGDLIKSTCVVRVKFKRRFPTDIVFESPVHIQMAPTPAFMKAGLQNYELLPISPLVLK